MEKKEIKITDTNSKLKFSSTETLTDIEVLGMLRLYEVKLIEKINKQQEREAAQ